MQFSSLVAHTGTCLAFVLSLSAGVSASGQSIDSNVSDAKSNNAKTDQTVPITNNNDLSLDQIRLESKETAGTIFRQSDEIEIRPPLLKALIQTQSQLSPYQFDADQAKSISLKEAAETALANNLAIKISNADKEQLKWQFWSSMGEFLPEVANSISYQGIQGRYASPFGLIASANSPYLVIPNTLNVYFFRGGRTLFGALKSNHEYKASAWSLKGTTNDVLLESTKLYYQLVLQNVLLQIRIKGVELGETLLARNRIMFENGANTQLDVLQASTQLSKDRQALISQQIDRRQAAINLSTALNLDPGVDLIVHDNLVRKTLLVDSKLKINDLVAIAVKNRPELKKFEQLRLAAKDNISVVRGRLLPTVSGSAGLAATGAKAAGTQEAQSSSASTGGISAGAFSSSSSVPAGSGGPARFSMAEIYQLGINIDWTLPGMGTVDAAKIQEARWGARKVQLEGVEQLNKVYKDVREAYLESIKADSLIEETTKYVESSREQLNVATVRLAEGVDTDLSAVIALRDYTNAMVDKANAIINFNIAQARLLRALGRITCDTLTRGIPITD